MQIVVLQILQWILRIMVVLLMAILLILFLVMLVPVRYRAEGGLQEKDFKIKGRVTWFFYLVYMKFVYEEGFWFQIRILGFKVFDSKKKNSGQKKLKSVPVNASGGTYVKTSENEEKKLPLPEEKKTDREKRTGQESLKKTLAETKTKEKEVKKAKKERKTLRSRIYSVYFKIKAFIQRIRNLIKKLKKDKEKAEHLLELWKKEETQITWQRAKKKFWKIIKALFPGKWKITGIIGFSDPAVTGYLMGALGCLYPVLGQKVEIIPDFEKEIKNIKGMGKGHIRLGNLFYQLVSFVLNKSCIQFIRLILEELEGSE